MSTVPPRVCSAVAVLPTVVKPLFGALGTDREGSVEYRSEHEICCLNRA